MNLSFHGELASNNTFMSLYLHHSIVMIMMTKERVGLGRTDCFRAVMLRTYIREILGSTLRRDTRYSNWNSS